MPPLRHHTLWVERQPRWRRKKEKEEVEIRGLPSHLHRHVSWQLERNWQTKEENEQECSIGYILDKTELVLSNKINFNIVSCSPG